MYPDRDVAMVAPSLRMASWSFYLGLLGLLAVGAALILQTLLPALVPILSIGGLILGVIAIVLGIVGLVSVNRISAIAGILLGLLAIVAYFYMPKVVG